jgi:DNA-binding beta-propeller fold protein YncE
MKRMRVRCHSVASLLLLAATIALPFAAAAEAEDAGFAIRDARPLLDGGLGWDHISIDVGHRHVFVGRGESGLAVLDADTGSYLRSIPETKGSHGAAVAPDLGVGFSDNGKGGDLTIFDLATLQPKAHLSVGANTDGVFYDPATRTALVNNGEGGHATIFDPVAVRVLGGIDLATKKPEFAVVDRSAFIDLQDRNSVARIDLRTRNLAEVWPVSGCELPSSIAIDEANNRLFVGCRGKEPTMAVLDAANGHVVSTLPIGAGNDWAGFDAERRVAFFANGQSANLTVIRQIDADHYREDETVGTRPLARTGAFDPRTGTVYLMTAQYSRAGPDADGKPAPIRIVPGSAELLLLRQKPGP